LSEAAKEQLAEALREAADDTEDVDSRLAELERQAAEALEGDDYDAQRQALEQLSEALELAGSNLAQGSESQQPRGDFDSSSDGSPGDQPTRDQRTGQPGRNDAGQGEDAGRDGQDDASDSADASSNERQSDEQAAGDERPGSADDDGSARLDTAGELVEVPLELVPGNSTSAGDDAPEPLTREGNSSSGGAGGAGSRAPGFVSGEQNLIRPDLRQIVLEYFKGGE
jgi:hypothetical protein